MRLPTDKKSLDILPSAILGGVCAAILAVLLLVLSSCLLLLTEDPGAHPRVGLICLFVCCAAGAFTGARCTDRLPFTAGLLSGAIFITTVTVISLFIPGGTEFILILPAAGVAAGGAFLGSVRSDAGRIPAFDDKIMDKYGK